MARQDHSELEKQLEGLGLGETFVHEEGEDADDEDDNSDRIMPCSSFDLVADDNKVGSPYGEDMFYECTANGRQWPQMPDQMGRTPPVSPPVAQATLELKIAAVRVQGGETVPLFSALRSPRGVRRRLKAFFMKTCEEDLARTESLVRDIASGETTEDEVFELLRNEYLCVDKEALNLAMYRKPAARGEGEDEGEEEEEEEQKDDDEAVSPRAAVDFDDEVELDEGMPGVSGHHKSVNPNEFYFSQLYEEHGLEHLDEDTMMRLRSDGNDRNVRFCDTVLAIRTDMGGMPLGPVTGPLREAHNVTKPLVPQQQSAWRPGLGRKKKKKRRMKRLSDADKIELYQWREDLVSQKFLDRQRRLQELARENEMTQGAMASSFGKNEGAPLYEPIPGSQEMEAQAEAEARARSQAQAHAKAQAHAVRPPPAQMGRAMPTSEPFVEAAVKPAPSKPAPRLVRSPGGGSKSSRNGTKSPPGSAGGKSTSSSSGSKRGSLGPMLNGTLHNASIMARRFARPRHLLPKMSSPTNAD